MVLPIPRPATTSHLYHYGSAGHRLAWLQAIILTHTLYVPTSTELNDPEEAKPRIKRLSPEGYAQFIDRYMERILPGLSGEVYGENARFLRTMSGLHGADAMRDQVSQLLYKSFEGTHIYSLSTHGDSEHMWENYASSHTGYCLEFANGGSFASAREVIYQDPNELDVSDADHAVSNWFYFKTQRWWLEQEVRLSSPRHPGAGVTLIVSVQTNCPESFSVTRSVWRTQGRSEHGRDTAARPCRWCVPSTTDTGGL